MHSVIGLSFELRSGIVDQLSAGLHLLYPRLASILASPPRPPPPSPLSSPLSSPISSPRPAPFWARCGVQLPPPAASPVCRSPPPREDTSVYVLPTNSHQRSFFCVLRGVGSAAGAPPPRRRLGACQRVDISSGCRRCGLDVRLFLGYFWVFTGFFWVFIIL